LFLFCLSWKTKSVLNPVPRAVVDGFGFQAELESLQSPPASLIYRPSSLAVMAQDRLPQLKQAEALVLQDPSHYPAILPAVLVFAAQPDIPLRRWIANFLTSTFASKTLDGQLKEDLAAGVVDTLRLFVDETDPGVLKSCVQCSSLIYPLLFRRM
jgi:hypothetical protein